MKLIPLVPTLLVSTSALAAPSLPLTRSQCDARIAAAQQEFKAIDSQVRVGQATTLDLLKVTLKGLDTAFECHGLRFTEYCATAPVAAAAILKGTQDLFGAGEVTRVEVDAAQAEVLAIENLSISKSKCVHLS
jgi:hypothetical protein